MNIILFKLGNFSIAYSYVVFSIYSIVPKSVRLRRKCIEFETRFVSPYCVHPRHFSLRYYLHAFTELFSVIYHENTFRLTVSAVTNSFGFDIFQHSMAWSHETFLQRKCRISHIDCRYSNISTGQNFVWLSMQVFFL
jgi:hypothetical protein